MQYTLYQQIIIEKREILLISSYSFQSWWDFLPLVEYRMNYMNELHIKLPNWNYILVELMCTALH